jgi:hypothetical protein
VTPLRLVILLPRLNVIVFFQVLLVRASDLSLAPAGSMQL